MLKGKCFVEGLATFGAGLKFGTTVKTSYSFEQHGVAAAHEDAFGKKELLECRGEDVTTKEAGPWKGVEAKVEGGEGNLECGTKSESTKEGTATIKLENAKGEKRTFESKFKFKPAAKEGILPVPGEIVAELSSKAGTAKGPANFLEPEEPGARVSIERCQSSAGAKTLSFETAEESTEGPVKLIGRLLPEPFKAEWKAIEKLLPEIAKVGIEGVIGE